jgi:microcin C transport system substrate-binding protein
MRTLLFLGLVFSALPGWAAHAYAQFGDIKYPAGFANFDYVNVQAPKGGEISLVPPTRLTNFDKYNPFTLKGSAPPSLNGFVFETLLTGNYDEPTTAYGLLAEDIDVAKDQLSATFRLNPLAKFQNGDPVLAADVKHSFDRLTSKEAAPQYRTIFGEVASATVVNERTVRFDFKLVNPELPLITGSMPIFSRKWGAGKPLDQIITDPPIGSGPYKIGRVNFGKDISYDRDPAYWARDLNVRRGMFNFDRVTYRIYKDNTAQTEAFKAGEFDYLQVFIAREWARSYTGKQFDSGELIKKELKHGNAGDFQGFLLNTRRDKFKDVRVRRAIELAMDYEWMNRQLFYNAYTRIRGYFVASDFEAKGKPSPQELALLEPYKNSLPAGILTDEVPLPPNTDAPNSLRGNLREAKRLLAEAGWTFKDGALRNAKGQAFEFEFLDSSGSMGRVVSPYTQALAKLGIKVNYKVIDFAILQKRQDVFDFDVISVRQVGSEAPGTELRERYGSKSADTEGSGNLIGIKNPAVDLLIDKATAATTRAELVVTLQALDRVLRHGYYVVPHWYGGVHRVAYRGGKFEQPSITPRYYQPESWITSTWWSKAAQPKPVASSGGAK